MRCFSKRPNLSSTFLFLTYTFCIALSLLVLFLIAHHSENNFNSFSEPVIELSDNWTLTDSSGETRKISFPITIEYGQDGQYTLTGTLPEEKELLITPALRFYSNYVDFDMELDGEQLYSYPKEKVAFSGSTGNTYHFIRLPADYVGKTITLTIHCQLGSRITYLLKSPLLGSKATMLNSDVLKSILPITLAGCMLIMAFGLVVLYFALRRRLIITSTILYTSLFAALFGIYVFCETSFAQILLPNGYALCCCTLMLLSLLPAPLIGLFSDDLSSKFRIIPNLLMVICSVNFIVQTCLNFFGILSFREALPATHFVIITTISVMMLCLFFSDRREKPSARKKLLCAIPMAIGGTTDIFLLSINRPSFNNSFWFTLGVTSFIIIQFCGYVRSFFQMYRTSLEAALLRDMAYRDALTDIGNRNAYENKLSELENKEFSGRLCCIVLDINGLKLINDRLGHQAGDTAIMEAGRLIDEFTPDSASCFRTGGDEFVVLLDEYEEKAVEELAERLVSEAESCGNQKSIPLSLAVGYGFYKPEDGSIANFISRVDTLMYECKRESKNSTKYPFSFFKNT